VIASSRAHLAPITASWFQLSTGCSDRFPRSAV
jgi:hypothetical protein